MMFIEIIALLIILAFGVGTIVLSWEKQTIKQKNRRKNDNSRNHCKTKLLKWQ